GGANGRSDDGAGAGRSRAAPQGAVRMSGGDFSLHLRFISPIEAHFARRPCSPSPKPSPLGRGSILGRAFDKLQRADFSSDRLRSPLSPRERVGVRGRKATDIL